VHRIRELVYKMDPLRRETLKFLIAFFREVVALESQNKMTSYNISVTTGPAIFRPKVMRADDLLNHATYYDALLKMIQYYNFIFNEGELELNQQDNLRHGQVGVVRLESLLEARQSKKLKTFEQKSVTSEEPRN